MRRLTVKKAEERGRNQVTLNQFPMDEGFAAFGSTTGIDEAGRGCLAGPVAIASVNWQVREASRLPWFADLGDSKTLSPGTRERLFPLILSHARRVRIALVSHILIDFLNILRATLYGFELTAPPFDPDAPLLIDGSQKPPSLPWARTVVKGDSRLSAVAAAGVVAKTFRDAFMAKVATDAPGYGFERHKGYATAEHRRALAAMGPSPMHRKSFRPVADMVPERAEEDGDPGALAVASAADRDRLWERFLQRYHRISPAAGKRWLQAFQARGLRALPGADGAPSRLVELHAWDAGRPAAPDEAQRAAVSSLSW